MLEGQADKLEITTMEAQEVKLDSINKEFKNIQENKAFIGENVKGTKFYDLATKENLSKQDNSIVSDIDKLLLSVYLENKIVEKKYYLSREIIVFSYYSLHPNASIKDFITFAKNNNFENITHDKTVRSLAYNYIDRENVRERVFDYINKVIVNLRKAILGDKKAFDEFLILQKFVPPYIPGILVDTNRIYRMIIIAFFSSFLKERTTKEANSIYHINDSVAKSALADIIKYVAKVNNFKVPENFEREDTPHSNKNSELLETIDYLNKKLAHANTVLENYEKESEARLQELKAQEITSFFSNLNSDYYGCILDELFALRKGILKLCKDNENLPAEVCSLICITDKLLKFVKDSHVNPIMRLNSVITVKASDIENCSYEGTPFVDDESKAVRVISPGWVYSDKKIIISCPKLKEEK